MLHLLAGPNGAGTSTLWERVLGPATGLPFVNADRIAATVWPGNEEIHGLVRHAAGLGYEVTLHVIAIPRALAVPRVASSFDVGGHSVPPIKVTERYDRLWPLGRDAMESAALTARLRQLVAARAFRRVLLYRPAVDAAPYVVGDLPAWFPPVLGDER